MFIVKFQAKYSFYILFYIFLVESNFFEDVLAAVPTSQIGVDEHEQAIIKAVQESMAEWKIRSSRHRLKRADKTVCYGDLGCFEDSGPFGYIDMLPSSPEEIDTKFLVYSTKNRSDNPLMQFYFLDIAQNTSYLNESITTTTKSTSVRESRNSSSAKEIPRRNATDIYAKFGNLTSTQIRIIVHGFGSSCDHVWIDEMRTALMAVEKFCFVLCVDWEKGATLPNYVKAAANTRLVGKQLAYLLKELNKNNQLEFSRVHLIGFSLGAHVSGFTGTEIKTLHRITGLDPAGPLFESQHPNARLDDSDAEFVDVIHSNGENLILGGLGTWQPLGHVDFYPNGLKQIGCSNLFLGAVTDIIWTPAAAVEGRSLCNHRRAYKFFIHSVAPRCLFPAFPCDSYENFLEGKCFECGKSSRDKNSTSVCGNMGYYADKSTGRGQLYLKTREDEPFCAHQYKLEIQSSYNELPLRTLGKIEAILESNSGLKEAFSVTDREDEELYAGEMFSKILVPHPGLNFPTIVTINYHVYRGWLSRGLSKWSISKVKLSDSFGKSFSLCQHFDLMTGVPVRMILEEGDCESPDYDLSTESQDNNVLDNQTESVTTTEPNELDNKINGNQTREELNVNIPPVIVKNTTEIIELGKHVIIGPTTEKSVTTKSSTSNHVAMVSTTEPWKPITTHMILEIINEKINNTTGDDKFLNYGERIPKKTKTEKRSFDNYEYVKSLSENSISMTSSTAKTTTETTVANEKIDNMATTTEMEKMVTVQLFPIRLADIFEKAEKYAKNTLFPFISESFLNFFNGKSNNETVKNDTNMETPVILDRISISSNTNDYRTSEEMDEKIIQNYKFLQKNSNTLEELPKSIEMMNPKNKTETTALTEMMPIHIDLPTYRPETMHKRGKKFIPVSIADND